MKYYIYDTETLEILSVIDGETNQECEKAGRLMYGDQDDIGGTYNKETLIDTTDTVYLDAKTVISGD